MANTATTLIITAGTITFANEWYQTKQINWRVPLATVLAALLFDGLSHVNEKAATGLAIMALLVSLLTRFNGHSVAETLAVTFRQQRKPRTRPHVQVA
jgi:glucokinase